VSVYKPKNSPYWHYDFVLKGRRFHGTTGVETRRRAEEIERTVRNQAATGALDSGAGMTIDQAAGLWWTEVGQHRASARQLAHRVAIVVRLLGKNTRIIDITTRTVSRAIETRRGETFARGKDRKKTQRSPARKAARYELANATINSDIIKPLRAILNRARKTWEVKGLPVIDWQALVLDEPESEILHFADDYQRAWLDACGPTERFLLELLLTYGWRFKEAFFPPEAFLPDTPEGPSLAVNKRKRGALLTPLLEEHARQIAARIGVARAAKLTTIWIEQDARGKLFDVSYSALQGRLRRAAKRAGVDHTRLIHSTRHHVGTDFLASTGDLRMTQQLLGHRDIRSTLVYAHALSSGVRAAIKSRNSPGGEPAAGEFTAPKQRTRRTR